MSAGTYNFTAVATTPEKVEEHAATSGRSSALSILAQKFVREFVQAGIPAAAVPLEVFRGLWRDAGADEDEVSALTPAKVRSKLDGPATNPAAGVLRGKRLGGEFVNVKIVRMDTGEIGLVNTSVKIEEKKS